MSTFSKRYGFEPEKSIQINSMDGDLRVGLWNALHLHFWQNVEDGLADPVAAKDLEKVVRRTWVHLFKWSLSELPWDWPNTERRIQEYYDKAKWYQVYDIIEYMAPLANVLKNSGTQGFIGFCNNVLDTECSAYRFVGSCIAPIIHKEEIREVETALKTPHDGVRVQINSALEKLSQKPEPDPRNSIKESIGAVETVAKLIDGRPDATLPGALARLKKSVTLHDDLEKGFKLLYDYTSDAEGIRHALMDKPNLNADDARYMLVSCSAFANYMLRLADRAGL